MKTVTNDYLIKKATSVIYHKKNVDSNFGDVGCALLTDKGKIYTGVSIDTWSGMGMCAERNAIASMITAREYKIKTIVAVWEDEKGKVHVVPPCGSCREFMHQVTKDGFNINVILSKTKVVKLRELLPTSDWYELDIFKK